MTAKKKSLPILIAILMVFAMMPMAAGTVFAEDTAVEFGTSDGFHYSNDYTIAGLGCDDGEVFLTGYDGPKTDLVIPSTVTHQGETYTVAGIVEEALSYTDEEYYAYWLNHDITSLTLPDTLRYIDQGAISNLGITELTIPESVTLIASHAISGCPDLKTIRVLSSRTGSADYYGEDCMGFYWNEDNQSVPNDGLVVYGVDKGAYSSDETDIHNWCLYNGVAFKGFPPSNPRWNGNTLTWDPPAYRADAVMFYVMHIYRNGSGYTIRTQNHANPTACSFDCTESIKSNGRGTYKAYVTAVCGIYDDRDIESERSGYSAEYAYSGPVNQYTITFDANGGSGTMAPVTVDTGDPYIMPEGTFTPPAGKEFLGWKIRDREYAAGQEIILRANETAMAQWKEAGDPGWVYSIGVPDIVLGPAHVGYTNNSALSEGLVIYNTGNRRFQGASYDVEVTDDTNNAFDYVQQTNYYYPAVNNYTTPAYFRPKLGLAPGTYTCKVTVTPPLPAEPVTANVSFTVEDHTWGNTWQSDGTHHWKKCTECTARTEKVAHDTNGSVTGNVAATFDADGNTGDKHCSVCGAVSEAGTPTPAGKYILESSATSSPDYVTAGATCGSMTVTPGDASKYNASIYEVYDTTDTDSLYSYNKLKNTDPFVAGHDYTLVIEFKAKSPYVYETSGGYQHRWSTYKFNGASNTSPYVSNFNSYNIRKVPELHCFAGTHSMSELDIEITEKEYTGDPITPEMQIYVYEEGDGLTPLVKNRDYKVIDIRDNTEVGTASVTIEGLGVFSGQRTCQFTIKPKQVGYPDVESFGDKIYTGSGFVPDPYVKVDGKTLVKDRDYSIALKNSKGTVVEAAVNVDWYEYDVSFKGNYYRANPYALYFAITQADISSANISGINAEYPETGSAVNPEPTVKWNGKTLKIGTDYTVSYEDNVKPGTATMTVSGKGNFNGTLTRTFVIQPSMKMATVTGISNKTYTGRALTQAPKVVLGGKTLTKETDYKAAYKSNKNVGTASLIITGKGAYSGTKTVTFKINPKGTSLSKLTKAKKAATVKWKKQSAKMSSSRITGYQILLATDSKFTKNKKAVTVKGYSKTSKKVTKLKGGKKYYVKIRTYKTVGGTKYYSPWSKVKTVKTKK